MTTMNTTNNRTETLFTTISSRSGKKPFSTLRTFSIQKQLCAAFVGTWNAAKTRFFTIKNRLKSLFTIRAFSLFDLRCPNSLPSKTSAFYAAKSLPTKFSFSGIKFHSTMKAFYPSIRDMFPFKWMKPCMGRPSKNFKILDSIIILLFIDVMNTLFFLKSSSNIFFHNISMFKHLVFSFIKRIASNIYKNISLSIESSSALPVMVIWTAFSFVFHDWFLSFCNKGYNT